MWLDPDKLAFLIFICVFASLMLGIYGERWRARWSRKAWRARKGMAGDRGRVLPFGVNAPTMSSDPAVQLTHVMNASFRKRRILSKTEARVFFAVEKALEQTDTGWRVMAQVNLGEILESDDKHAFTAINSKRVDVLVIGTEGTPIAAIEYQGQGHYRGTAAARDAVKKEALRRAGVGYFEVTPGDKPEDVRRMVARMVEVEGMRKT